MRTVCIELTLYLKNMNLTCAPGLHLTKSANKRKQWGRWRKMMETNRKTNPREGRSQTNIRLGVTTLHESNRIPRSEMTSRADCRKNQGVVIQDPSSSGRRRSCEKPRACLSHSRAMRGTGRPQPKV
ncbi:hypothetical protein BC936DRAFT_149667 [Jimgerdemannia flammicorona]|uniref:Uncharacterized protein n=1 Tax=Jimgerdemannia flammicorona TaxID=994334 RepID=A0A433D0D1_9FUNG|nr:hypothetical protein BC936DRAFT_149667 [Jimgerdemannia flammicorona]